MARERTKRLDAREKESEGAGKGHNSADDPEKKIKLILKVGKSQKKLDEERETATTGFRERHKALTGELKAGGISRAEFKDEYDLWVARQNADTAEAERKVKAEQIVGRANRGLAYRAFNEGAQLDMFQVDKEAAKAREHLAKIEEAAAEGAESEL